MNRVYFICSSFTAFKLLEYLAEPMATFPLWITNPQLIRSTNKLWVNLTARSISSMKHSLKKDTLILCCSINNLDLRYSFKASKLLNKDFVLHSACFQTLTALGQI